VSSAARDLESASPRDEAIALDWRLRERRGRRRRRSGWQTSGGVVVDVRTGRVLLVKNRRERGEGRRGWTWPKGLIDPGEGPVFAALREIVEEAGVMAEPVGRIALLQTSRALRHYFLLWMIADGLPHRRETVRIKWVGLDRAKGLLERKRDRQVLRAAKHMLQQLRQGGLEPGWDLLAAG
jgi:8-oxo-dGTP pyrophosphatase MutT (NUDIX family)